MTRAGATHEALAASSELADDGGSGAGAGAGFKGGSHFGLSGTVHSGSGSDLEKGAVGAATEMSGLALQ